MQPAIIALAALAVLFGVQDGRAWPNSNSKVDYDAINHMLVQNVPTDDVAANMAVAKEAYEKRVGVKKNSFMKALENFVALDTIASRDRCNVAGYEILNAIDLGTRGQARGDPIRRIDKIVQFYNIQHATFCQDVFPELIARGKKSVSEQTKKYIGSMIDAAVQSRHLYNNCTWLDPEFELEIFTSFRPTRILKLMAAGDPDAKYLGQISDQKRGVMLANQAKRIELFNKYIYNPCNEFNDKIGEEYRHVLGFDHASSEKGCHKNLKDKLAIYICHRFVNDKKARKIVLAALSKAE